MINLLNDFMNWLNCQNILVYNEFSLQFELACFLRSKGFTVRSERNVSSYVPKGTAKQFIKKEIDLVAFKGQDEMNAEKIAIELKFPRNGQVPEQMFSFIKDIRFMEQVGAILGFTETYVLCLVDSPNFYKYEPNQSGIYKYFRNQNDTINIPGNKTITKPTDKRTINIILTNSYSSQWLKPTAKWLDTLSVNNTPTNLNNYRYYIIDVKGVPAPPSGFGGKPLSLGLNPDGLSIP